MVALSGNWPNTASMPTTHSALKIPEELLCIPNMGEELAHVKVMHYFEIVVTYLKQQIYIY